MTDKPEYKPVPHPDVATRQAKGKAARAAMPRGEHSALEQLRLHRLLVERGEGGQGAGEREPDRGRDHEAKVRLLEQDAGGRERV